MRYSSAILAFAAPLLASAAPAFRRAAAASDILVYRFAHVLEQVESGYYKKALSKFSASDFTNAGYTSSQVPIEQLTIIQADEAAHTSILQDTIKGLGSQPITNCQFNFDSALTDVTTMAATARVVEVVGIAAYLGAAHLLSDPRLLTAAGSILTVEARHQTILNLLSKTGTAVPAAFDLAFTPSEVLAIVSPFVSGCDVGVPSNVPLSITNTGTVAPGTLVTFKASSINGTIPNDKLFCQMMIGGVTESIALPLSKCVVPQGINGPVAIFITNDGQPLNSGVVDRATVNVIAGPTVAFIDTVPQAINQLIISGQPGGSGNSSAPSSTTTATLTISPSQASAIASSANSATPSPTPAGGASVVPGAGSAAPPAATPIATAGSGPNLFSGASPDGKIKVNGWNI